MRFRPCIDIHNGCVKQIVGGSLRDEGDQATDNFVSEQDGAFYADFYRRDDLKGGHIILLNPVSSPYYQATKAQAMKALAAWPQGMQIGGGMNPENAEDFLDAGASHVIITSYVFRNGQIQEENLEKMIRAVGKEHLVLDLSCRKREGAYYIVTDRWQNFTDVMLNEDTLNHLAGCCDEFLVHAVDVEGKAKGVEEEVLKLLGRWKKIPATYAGGVGSFEDLAKVRLLGENHVDVTIGSALDLFGGHMGYRDVLDYVNNKG